MGCLRRILRQVLALAIATAAAAAAARGEAFSVRVPLRLGPAGTLYLSGTVNGQAAAEYLLDTGAGYVTVGRSLFREITRAGRAVPAGKVAARLANGAFEVLTLYEVEGFAIGPRCALGPILVAVMARDARPILGLQALAKVAPFAVHLTPPELALSGCRTEAGALATAPVRSG